MSKYVSDLFDGDLNAGLRDIDARLTALEGKKRPKFNPENVIAKMYACADAVEQAAMNYEKAAASESPKVVGKDLAGVLAVQKREAESNPSDAYMVGLYNGLLLATTPDGERYEPMKTLKQRPEVIGACVIRDDVNIIPTWTLPHGPQYVREDYALKHARSYGGTAHRLVLGEEITP